MSTRTRTELAAWGSRNSSVRRELAAWGKAAVFCLLLLAALAALVLAGAWTTTLGGQ